MLNHIHLLSSGRDNILLSDIMRDFKRHTSTEITETLEKDHEKYLLYIFKKAGEKQGSKIKIWQDEYHPEAIYSEKWFHQKLNYMHENPVRKGFVLHPENWKYSSARNWLFDDFSTITLDLDML
jgi:REP element-mobilizing transposase RayT